MDDYSISSLTESHNEWCARLVNILTPLFIDGFKSIFDESWKICKENDELDKYLMTFQNFIGRVPKWNTTIIEDEKKRIIEKSNCGYLEELITCVHIIKLKALTCIRVSKKQKKIDINIPPLGEFIHKVYINIARKIYTNVYLFEKNISPLQIQKNNREMDLIVKECILTTIRDSIPVETLLKAYMDETQETDVEIEEKIEEKEVEVQQNGNSNTSNTDDNKNTNAQLDEPIAKTTLDTHTDLKKRVNISDRVKFADAPNIRTFTNDDDESSADSIPTDDYSPFKNSTTYNDEMNKLKIGEVLSKLDTDIVDIAKKDDHDIHLDIEELE